MGFHIAVFSCRQEKRHKVNRPLLDFTGEVRDSTGPHTHREARRAALGYFSSQNIVLHPKRGLMPEGARSYGNASARGWLCVLMIPHRSTQPYVPTTTSRAEVYRPTFLPFPATYHGRFQLDFVRVLRRLPLRFQTTAFHVILDLLQGVRETCFLCARTHAVTVML